MIKKTLLLVLVLLLALPVFIALSLWLGIPRSEIDQLKEGYVLVEVLEDQTPLYTFVDQRPEHWVSYDELDEKLKMAFVISEDWSFYDHRGVDWAQVKKALEQHFRDGERLRGASTISQQLVKNLFLTHDRSLYRKISELMITRELEDKLSKQKILELYLNIIQYGEGLYGVEQAAQFYFKTSAKELNVREAAFLAMLLPSPVRYAQSYQDRKLTEYAEGTIASIIEKLRVQGTLSQEEANFANRLPLRFDGIQPRPAQRTETRAQPQRSRLQLDDDGSAFERRYYVDEELTLELSPSFDPSSLDIPEEMIEVEFSLE